MSLFPFTAHNIALPDGTRTIPEVAELLEDGSVFAAAVRMLRLAFADGVSGKTIADLGCLEGGYATGFARLGMEATGFEIRDISLSRARWVADKLRLPALDFVKEDINNIDRYGPFDALWVCGVLYHLDNPARLLEKIGRICKRILLLETHFAVSGPEGDRPYLSGICEHEGFAGRWYNEFPQDVTDELRETSLWASWLNKSSFWLQREHLLCQLQRVGFDIVLEQYDRFPDIASGMDNYYYPQNRGLFVGIKSGPQEATRMFDQVKSRFRRSWAVVTRRND
jgi:SAM-dependent methyltransferase